MFPRLCIFFCETDGTGYFMSFCNKRKKGQQLPVVWRRHPNTETSFDPSGWCSMMANCMISKSSLLQNTVQHASKNSPLAAAAILPSSSLQTHIIRIKSTSSKVQTSERKQGFPLSLSSSSSSFFYQNCSFELHRLQNFFLFHNTQFNPNARAKPRVLIFRV